MHISLRRGEKKENLLLRQQRKRAYERRSGKCTINDMANSLQDYCPFRYVLEAPIPIAILPLHSLPLLWVDETPSPHHPQAHGPYAADKFPIFQSTVMSDTEKQR